jgi:sodium/potassium-transporting ATPase subunit alpha
MPHHDHLMIGNTKETLSAKTGRPVQEIYEDEVSTMVIHDDELDSLEGWQWDFSRSRAPPCHMLY